MNNQAFNSWIHQSRRSPLVMGVLNVTYDSFSDGGQFVCPKLAFERAQIMIEQGADIIDVGGESSRPGAVPISADEELRRVIPVIERIRAFSDVCISVDTHKPRVMREAIQAGASWINDITALTSEGALETVAELKVPVCLMHMKGTPLTMQDNPDYVDILQEINGFFEARIQACLNVNIDRRLLILDPGFGFGKSVQHNLDLIRHFDHFEQHGLPLMIGISRKSTLGILLNQDIHQRMSGGIALTVFAVLQGASMVRTHDVLETKQALMILDALNV